LKTVKEYVGIIQLWLGRKLIKLGIILANNGEITGKTFEKARLKANFAPFKEASNHGKEILTIVEEGDLGPIYKN
jgi:hypothetical protein